MGLKFLKIIWGFISKFYDKIVLGILLLFLAIVLIFQTDKLKVTQEEVNKADQDLQRKLPTNDIEPLDQAQFELDFSLQQDRLWKEDYSEGSLVEPGNYVYSMDGGPYLLHLTTRKSPFTGSWDLPEVPKADAGHPSATASGSGDINKDSDNDGLPDFVEAEAGLNKDDPSDAYTDLDGDGFNNLDEYKAETGLQDSSSRPKLANKLRFLKKIRTPLNVKLKRVNRNDDEDKRKWDIEIKYKSGKRWKSEFLRIGGRIPQLGYDLIDAEYKENVEGGVPVDASQITIKKNDEPAVTVHRNRVAYAGDDIYEILYLAEKPIKLRTKLGRSFVIQDSKGAEETYELKDASNLEQLVFELTASKETFTVRKFSNEDKLQMK